MRVLRPRAAQPRVERVYPRRVMPAFVNANNRIACRGWPRRLVGVVQVVSVEGGRRAAVAHDNAVSPRGDG